METRYRESDNDKFLRKWFANDMSRGLLRRIELREGVLRGLSPFRLKIDYPITAIAGRNGAGKSTILALACCAYHNNKDGFRRKKQRNPYYTFSDFFVQHREEVPPQGIEIYYQFAYNNWRKSELYPEGIGLGYQKRWKRKGGKWNDYSGRIRSNVAFLGIDRIVPHSERSYSKSYSKNFKDPVPQGWEVKVEKAVGFILGKEYSKLRYLEHSKYKLPIVNCSGATYSGLNMGAGENALFEIFRIIYSCGKGAFLVIDEIELGLHIDAQRKLIKKLKEACLDRKLQIMCTTHSREIFDGLPPDARKYLEKQNSGTLITEGIAPDFAMAKMGAHEAKELQVLVEDGVASDILSIVLPTLTRQRLNIKIVGSATALSRQLAAAYTRDDDRAFFAVFDGDQRKLQGKNIEHARRMTETGGELFENWFRDRISYLPGETWPEAWLIEVNKEYVASLSESIDIEENSLSGILEYSLQAGKHEEFHELAKHMGLNKSQCIQYLITNIKSNSPGLFDEITALIENMLE